MGREKREFQNTHDVLRRFRSKDTTTVRKAYRRFILDGVSKETQMELVALVRSINLGTGKGREYHRWVIGDADFVNKVIGESQQLRLRTSRFTQSGGKLSSLVQKISKVFGISNDSLPVRQRGGVGSDAKKAFCYLAVRQLGAPTKTAAEFLGISPGAVSNMLRQGKEIAESKGLLSI
jgi:hypothetical protein